MRLRAGDDGRRARHGALIYGVSNTFATIPGIIGVAVTGWLVDRTGTYTAGFALAAGVSVVGAILFAVLFDARPLTKPGESDRARSTGKREVSSHRG